MSAPRLARLLIRLSAGAGRRDDALGDLEEAHRRRQARGSARAWFGSMAEALMIALMLVGHRLARAGRAAREARVGLSEVRLAFRLLTRQPLMALTAVVALSVGIGLANVGFAVTEAMLFSRLPFEGGDRLVRLETVTSLEREPVMLSSQSYLRLATSVGALDHVGAFTGSRDVVTLPGGQSHAVIIAGITASSLRYLPGAPLRGRLLAPGDGAPGAAPVALISETLWRRSLSASEAAVGSTVEVGSTTRTIVGVMPAAFEFPNAPALWLPLDERFIEGGALPDTDASLFGVMASGATLATVSAQLAALAPALRPSSGEGQISLAALGFTDLGPMGAEISAALIITVFAVLVVIAANVGNLVLARSLSRVREFALRAALGASRGRLVAQVVVEVLVLGGVAAILGSLSAQVVLRLFNTMEELPFWVDFTGGPLTAGLVAASTLFATAIAGAWPALRATRRDLLGSLQSAGGRTTGVRFGRTAGLMVVVQIAVSVVMLHGALVVARAFRDYTEVQLDLPPNVITMGLGVNAVRVTADGRRSIPLTAVDAEEIAASLPGVIAAGTTTALPRHSPRAQLIELEPLPGEPESPSRLAPSAAVSPAYFDALGAAASAGRLLNAADTQPGAPAVAVVNEPFTRKILGNGLAIGRRFRVLDADGRGPWREIVGVVPDLGLSVGDPNLSAGYYVPLTREANVVYLALRVNGEPAEFGEPLRRALRAREPELVPFRAERLEDVALEDRAFFAGFSSALLGIGGVTLVLALVGLYSMLSLAVGHRTREIGIRVALGATTARVVRSVAGRAAGQVLSGATLGALLAVVSLQGRAVLVSRLGDGGPWTLPAVIALLMASGVAATWVPLRRALRIRPQDALKAE